MVRSELLLGYWRVSKGLQDGQVWLDVAKKIACEQLMATFPALKRMSLQFHKEMFWQLLASSVGTTAVVPTEIEIEIEIGALGHHHPWVVVPHKSQLWYTWLYNHSS